MVKKDLMLQHFMGEVIGVLLNGSMAVTSDGGEHYEEVPIVFSGKLLDFDEHFLMLADTEESPPQLINRNAILRIVVGEGEGIPEGTVVN